MIIDVRGILNAIDKERDNDTGYSIDMEYTADGNFTPKLKSDRATKSIRAMDGDRELVGLGIVCVTAYNSMQVLTCNGLFVNSGTVHTADVLLIPSYQDAVSFIEKLQNGNYTKTTVANRVFKIFAAYQKFGVDSISFKQVI